MIWLFAYRKPVYHMNVFNQLNAVIQKLLSNEGLSEPTAPQIEAIPKILAGKDSSRKTSGKKGHPGEDQGGLFRFEGNMFIFIPKASLIEAEK